MDIIIKGSFEGLKTLPENAKITASKIIRAIQAAPTINQLKSVLPNDVIITNGESYNALIKDNYQHVVACIHIVIDKRSRAVIMFQPYD